MQTGSEELTGALKGEKPKRRRRHFGRYIAALQSAVLALPWVLLWCLWPRPVHAPKPERSSRGRVSYIRFEPGQDMSYLMPDVFSRGNGDHPGDDGHPSRAVPTLGETLGNPGHPLKWETSNAGAPSPARSAIELSSVLEQQTSTPTPAEDPVFRSMPVAKPKLEVVMDGALQGSGFAFSDEARIVLAGGEKSWHCGLRLEAGQDPEIVHILVERSSGDRARDRQVVSAVRQALRGVPLDAEGARLLVRYLAP